MAITGGRQVKVGVAMEATAGTGVAPTFFPQWLTYSLNPVAEKAFFKGARGVRNETSASYIRRKYGQGSIQVVPTPSSLAYFFRAALGSISSVLHSGETTVWDHTITVQNNNASMKTMTLVSDESNIIEQYTNTVIESLNLEIGNDYGKFTASMIGQFPATTTQAASYAAETFFAYKDMTLKLGTTLTAAGSATATPIRDFKLALNNNVLLDEAFLSGANTVAAGGFIAGPLKITGSYLVQFKDLVETAKYEANTKNAAIITLTGAAVGSASTESVQIKLGALILTKPTKQFNLDGIVMVQQEFEVIYDPTDKEITVLVTSTDSATNLA